MSDRREEEEKGEQVILKSSKDYPKWKSYTIWILKEKNCDWIIIGRPKPIREIIQANLKSLGFSPLNFAVQTIYTSLSTEIKEHRAAIKKGEGIIWKSVAHKHHPILEEKTWQKMWQILKEKHVSPMSISRKILEATRIEVSNWKNIYKYTNAYQESLGDVYSLTTEDSELTTKGASMTLQAAFLTNMGPEYVGMVSMIEAK